MGFTADEYVIFKLDKNDPRDYISETERLKFRGNLRGKSVILDNKIVFYNIIRNFAEVNKIYGYKMQTSFVSLEPGWEENNIVEKVKEHHKLVYKKQGAGGGNGFKLLSYSNGIFYINNEIASEKDITDLVVSQNDYLIEEFCVQAAFENEIYPHSVNTLRIITVEMKEAKHKAICAFHRFGVDAKKCVDNACAGGLYAMIDVQSGKLSYARSHAKEFFVDENGKDIIFQNHPVTNHQIEGVIIPDWENIVFTVETLHKKISFTGIDFIAWDIALTETGMKVIEANASCSTDFLQTFEAHRKSELGKWLKDRGYI